MAEKTQYGVAIPQVFTDGPVDMGLVATWAKRAEELGYHSLWVQEGITGDVVILEPVTLLCYVAALTERVRLGTSVMLAPLRNPVQLAKSLGSLDQMSQGRLIVGIGLGTRMTDFPIFGIPPERRTRRLVEVLQVMKSLWTQSEAHFQGNFWQLDGTPMEPKPVQRPHPPIWFGGRHPSALKRAVRHGDGWMGAGSSSTEQFKEAVGYVRTYLEEADRDPATFAISKRVYVAVDNDANRAERRLREWFGKRYGNADMAAQVSVWGTASHCAEKVAEVVDSGAQLVLLNTAFDHMEHLDILTEEVIPAV